MNITNLSELERVERHTTYRPVRKSRATRDDNMMDKCRTLGRRQARRMREGAR